MPDALVIARFQAQQARLLAEVERIMSEAWAALPAYYDDNAAAFLATTQRTLPAAQTAMGRLVDGYVAALTGLPPVGIPPDAVTDVRGVPLAEEYVRPFIQVRKGLAEGAGPLEQLASAAGDRVVKMATMDTQIAMRNSMTHIAEVNPRVHGYRRVLTGKSCMFCASASTRRYHKHDLMPLHAHCDCGVAPIIGDRDPGEVVNAKVLDKLKAQGPDYWKRSGFVDAEGNPVNPTDVPADLAAVTHHDELGPLLNA